VAHPTRDVLAVQITSSLVADGTLGARLHFPYAPADWLHAGDWIQPDKPATTVDSQQGETHFARQFDGTTRYSARAAVSPGAKYVQVGPHEFTWHASGQSSIHLVLALRLSRWTPDSGGTQPCWGRWGLCRKRLW